MSTTIPKTNYLTGHAPSATQHHEWRTAINSAAHLVSHLTTLTNPVKLLDVGCGSGTITASLSKYLPASSTITAIDASAEIISKAQAHAQAQGVTNIEFRTGDIYNLPFSDGEFDVVHVSMLLMHLSEPKRAIKELLRVVRPGGGVLSLREPDMRGWSFYPALPAITEFNSTICAVLVSNGAQIDAGQRLVSWVLKCGAGVTRDQVRASASAWCFSTEKERKVWGGTMVGRCETGEMREKAIKEGLKTGDDFERMKKGWEEWIGTEDGWFAALCGEVLVFL